MALRCKICNHEQRAVIDARIAAGDPYLRIATDFKLNDKTVGTHAKNHVEPFVAEIERAAQAAVLETVRSYRKEVHLPLQDKSKRMEEKLLDAFDEAEELGVKVAIAREIRGQQQEQAKLTGAYQRDAPNDTSLDRVVASYRMIEEMYPDAGEQDRSSWLENLAKHSGVPAEAIRRQIKIQEIDGVQ